MAERLCPFGDGRHKKRPWHDKEANRSGFACVRCSKTWAWVDLSPKHGATVETWKLFGHE